MLLHAFFGYRVVQTQILALEKRGTDILQKLID